MAGYEDEEELTEEELELIRKKRKERQDAYKVGQDNYDRAQEGAEDYMAGPEWFKKLRKMVSSK